MYLFSIYIYIYMADIDIDNSFEMLWYNLKLFIHKFKNKIIHTNYNY